MSTKPFWAIAELVNAVEPPLEFQVSLEDMVPGTGHLVDGELSSYSAKGIRFQPGDVLFGKLRPYLAKYWLADRKGTAGGDIHVYRPVRGVEPQFLQYVVATDDFVSFAEAASKGTKMPRAEWGSLREFRVLDLPAAAQKTAAEFLNRELAEIDAMDAELNHLTQTLQERRSSAIENRLWSGSSRTVALKMDCEFVTSGSRGWAEFYADEGDRFLRIADLDRGTHQLKDGAPQHVKIPAGTEGTRTRTEVGDLLFSITAYLGSVGLVTDSHVGAYVSQHVALVRLNARIWKPEFVAYAALSASGQRYLTETGYGGTKTQLNLDQVRDIPVPLMSQADQERIVRDLDEQTTRIDDMIADAHKLKTLLAERRSTLITDVVTGKKEVPA